MSTTHEQPPWLPARLAFAMSAAIEVLPGHQRAFAGEVARVTLRGHRRKGQRIPATPLRLSSGEAEGVRRALDAAADMVLLAHLQVGMEVLVGCGEGQERHCRIHNITHGEPHPIRVGAGEGPTQQIALEEILAPTLASVCPHCGQPGSGQEDAFEGLRLTDAETAALRAFHNGLLRGAGRRVIGSTLGEEHIPAYHSAIARIDNHPAPPSPPTP
jgi:hypothetical protein